MVTACRCVSGSAGQRMNKNRSKSLSGRPRFPWTCRAGEELEGALGRRSASAEAGSQLTLEYYGAEDLSSSGEALNLRV